MRSRLIIPPVASALLAACGSTQASSEFWFPERNEELTEVTTEESSETELPPHYAELFVEGRTWSYVGERDERFNDPEHELADSEGSVHVLTQWAQDCSVDRVGVQEGVLTSTILCSPESDVSVAGVYAAYSTGLYRVTADDLSAHPANFLIAATPVADDRSPTNQIEGAGITVTYRPDGAWCSNSWALAGDEFSTEHCFADGVGIVAIDDVFAGGMMVDQRLRVRR